MRVTIFGAAGLTGLWACRLALDAGHSVVAVSRRADPLPLPPDENLRQVRADAQSGIGVPEAVDGADAVLSTLGSPYTRKPVHIYAEGTRSIVTAMREHGCGRHLVVVSSGLTYPPPHMNVLADHLLFPLLRSVLGRTLYADMREMESDLRSAPDIDWTVMRPGRLIDAPSVSPYRIDPDHPVQGYTTRPDLAAAMVDELGRTDHLHAAIAPTTDMRGRRR